MHHIDEAAIERFIADHRIALAWCLRDAGGLWEADELANEVALQILTVRAEHAWLLDLDTGTGAAEMLRILRRQARRAGRGMRRLVRPDQAGTGEDWHIGDLRWEHLASDNGAHPGSLIEAAAQPQASDPEFDPYHSELGAWHALARRVGARTHEMADFLLISASWCGRCRRRARERALAQHMLPPPELRYEDDDGALRP